MNGYPELDYEALRKAMQKKAMPPTGERDPDDDMGPQAPPQQGAKTTGSPKLDQLLAMKEDLESDLADARNKAQFEKVTSTNIKLEKLKGFITEVTEDERIQSMIEDKVPMPQIMKFLDKIIEKKQWYQRVEMRTPLEEQLEHAIKEERYEEAGPIQQDLDRFQKLLRSRRVLDRVVVGADNLDVIQPDKPFDLHEPVQQVKTRHRMRYRNEPGGSDEMFWEGMSGTLNKEKGIGTDQQGTTGGSASIETLSAIKPRLKPVMRPQEQTMPGEKMERDPLEEKQTTDVWREYQDIPGEIGR